MPCANCAPVCWWLCVAQVALNVDKDDVAIAIKEDERLAPLHQLI